MPPRTPKEPALKLVGTPAAKAASGPRPAKPAAMAAAAKAARPARAQKPVKAAKPAAKSAARPAADPATSGKLKLRDLVDSVASATGTSKKDARLAIEATLEALAAALKRGDDLNLPPLGRARVAKSAEKDGNATLTLKLRLGGAAKPGAKQGLADDGEDS